MERRERARWVLSHSSWRTQFTYPVDPPPTPYRQDLVSSCLQYAPLLRTFTFFSSLLGLSRLGKLESFSLLSLLFVSRNPHKPFPPLR